MKFKIAEFDIEEFEGFDEKEQERQNSVLNEFEDGKLRENLRNIFAKSKKHYFRYAISANGNFVGEITFSGNDEETKFEIGIEIEESFRNQGIAYRVLKELMLWLCKLKKIKHFIYTVRYDNTASIRLVEKLGGVQVKVVKPLEQFELAIYIYHIPPIMA